MSVNVKNFKGFSRLSPFFYYFLLKQVRKGRELAFKCRWSTRSKSLAAIVSVATLVDEMKGFCIVNKGLFFPCNQSNMVPIK